MPPCYTGVFFCFGRIQTVYHVELRGLEIESHKNTDVPYVSQSSVEIITAIAERATGRISDPATARHHRSRRLCCSRIKTGIFW